jgi:hypothetical protein
MSDLTDFLEELFPPPPLPRMESGTVVGPDAIQSVTGAAYTETPTTIATGRLSRGQPVVLARAGRAPVILAVGGFYSPGSKKLRTS